MTKDEAVRAIQKAIMSELDGDYGDLVGAINFIRSQAKELEQLQAENAELKKELAEIKIPKTKGDDDSTTFSSAAFIRWEARHKDTLKENAELKRSNTILQHNHSNLMSDHAEIEEAYAELKAKLENAIIPKFKLAQAVWTHEFKDFYKHRKPLLPVATKGVVIGININYEGILYEVKNSKNEIRVWIEEDLTSRHKQAEAAQAGGK